MKSIYLVKSFDSANFHLSPAIIAFETEIEAQEYCRLNTKGTLLYSWDKIPIGKMLP